MITAAPAPWSARAAISTSSPGAAAHSAEAPVNSARPGQEDALAPDPVGDPARRHEQRGDDDEVGVEDPREVRRRSVRERGGDPGERRVHDRGVQERQEAAGARGRDRESAPTRARPSGRRAGERRGRTRRRPYGRHRPGDIPRTPVFRAARPAPCATEPPASRTPSTGAPRPCGWSRTGRARSPCWSVRRRRAPRPGARSG